MEQTNDIPPLPEPWKDRQARAVETAGCARPAAGGCGCLAVGALIALIGLAIASNYLAPRLIGWLQVEVVSALTDEARAGEEAQLNAAFDSLRSALQDKRVDTAHLVELQRALGAALREAASGGVSLQSATELRLALERAAGSAQLPSTPRRVGEAEA